MKTILVDDEQAAIALFAYEAEKIPDIELLGAFYSAEEALDYVQDHPVELAVLDIEMNGMNGILLGRMLTALFPDILLVYITAYEAYAMQAIRLHAAAYLLKPYSSEELIYSVETARLLSKRRRKRIFVKTFGHFDVFVDGKPILFRSGKAKELLALLVDRQGGTVNTDQAICTLWEDRPNDEATQNLCSKVTRGLVKELKEYNAQDMVIASRGVRSVDTETFQCDLYALLQNDNAAKRNFVGEYMVDYSWAEERMAQLTKYMV
ncbi:MAG: response regulator [Clostridiaceae bacterium]|nr:response regulator [Clostridiaceae bacterium]